MARQKLLSFFFSAILIALVAVTTMRMVATHARTTLDERLPVLALAGQTVVSQFAAANDDLTTLANQIARDDGLASELRILDSLLVVLTASRAPGERLKKQVADQTTLVEQRLEAARTQAARDSTTVALLDDQGQVQVSDDPALPQGARFSALVPPPPTPPRVDVTDDDDLDTPAPALARVAPPVLIADAFNDTLRAGFDNKDAFVLRSDEETLLHVAIAPIVARDKVAGVVILERPVPQAKPIPHIATATLLDGKVKSGAVPEGVDFKGTGLQQLPHIVSFPLPVLGVVQMQPLFVDPQVVGIWAHRFDISGLPGMSGIAYADFASSFADVARMQVMIALLAAALAIGIGLIIAFTGFSVMRGMSGIADVISTNQQRGEQTRLQERAYPEALHRLVRLINKELEKGATAKSQTGRNAKIEEIIQKKKSVTLVDVDALDFGDAAPATLRDPTAAADNGSGSFATMPENARAAHMLSSLEDPSNTLKSETLANQKRLAEIAAADVQPPPRPTASSPPSRPSAPADSRTLVYRKLYDTFVATRKQCGEPLDDLSFGTFAQRLEETRDQLMKRQSVRDVKFDVYVKNGKAALKVTPVP
ncbi:MAG: hypothetical protein H7Z43_13325 [Clostridia bacterium]|nr:hypothetical protein [Deltaproteobacteria bacterium]